MFQVAKKFFSKKQFYYFAVSNLVKVEGVEPSIPGLKVPCFTIELHFQVCRERESNPHGIIRLILSQLCLPFHHPGIVAGRGVEPLL